MIILKDQIGATFLLLILLPFHNTFRDEESELWAIIPFLRTKPLFLIMLANKIERSLFLENSRTFPSIEGNGLSTIRAKFNAFHIALGRFIGIHSHSHPLSLSH